MGVKNIQGELRVNDEIVATQDWINERLTDYVVEPSIIATFNITEVNTTIALKNINRMTQINWGDGITDSNLSHIYSAPGEYTCTIFSATSIGKQAFYDCGSLTSVVMNDMVSEIGASAFSHCDKLANVIIGSNVTSIGLAAFNNCQSLMKIVIPSNVTKIGVSAFISSNATIYCEVESKPSGWELSNSDTNSDWNSSRPVVWNCKYNTIADDGYIYVTINDINYGIIDNKAMVANQSRTMVQAMIPSLIYYKAKHYNVIEIKDEAFRSCMFLTNVDIQDGIMSINNHAFSNCSSLTSIEIPDSVTTIGDSAFEHCYCLTSVIISIGAKQIGDFVFDICRKLKEVKFRNPIPIEYKESWFTGCSSLTHIYVPYGCKQAYIDKWTADGAPQDILDKIVESDREAMMSDVNALKTEIQAELVGKTDYLGTVSSMTGLSTIAGAGDYHRVLTEFVYDEATGEMAHIGDILIAVIDNPGQTKEYWDLVHTEFGAAPATSEDINALFEEA